MSSLPTMMMYHNKRSSAPRRAIVGLLFFTLILVGISFAFRPFLSGMVLPPVAALWEGSGFLQERTASLFAFFRFKKNLIAENAKMKEELNESKTMVLDRNILYEENLALKERLGRVAHPNAALASVILKPPATPYDTLIIDAGSDEALAVGDTVAAYGTVRIGKVTDVYKTTARVQLYSAPNTSYDGFLRGAIPVMVEGQGGGSLRMEVPYDAQVVEGDLVTLPGLESNIAFIVEYVKRGQGDSATVAYLRLPVAPSELKFVDVWRHNGEE